MPRWKLRWLLRIRRAFLNSFNRWRKIACLAIVATTIVTIASSLIASNAVETRTVALRLRVGGADCHAYFVAPDNGSEISAPCAEATSLSRSGPYLGWIEQSDRITPFSTTISGDDTASEITLDPLSNAGTILLNPGYSLAPGEHLRWMRLDVHRFAGEWRPLFVRPATADRTRTAIRVPAGRVVAAIVDDRGDVLALGRPLRVGAGSKLTTEWPRRPTSGTDLFVTLQRPRVPEAATDGVTLLIHDGGRSRPPDAIADAADQIVAIWYSVESRSVRIAADSAALWLPPLEIPLQPRRVVTVREALRIRPKLDVEIGSMPKGRVSTDLPEINVTVGDVKGGILQQAKVAPGMRQIFDNLPAEHLRVTLHIDKWKILRTVDLTDGTDNTVTFRLEPIIISGTVYHSGQPAAAELAFHQFDDWIEVESDEQGRYEVTLWQPRHYFIHVRVRGSDAAEPFREAVKIDVTRTLDFHVPNTRIVVRVGDESSGRGIANAVVTPRSTWADGSDRGSAQVQPVLTDENGSAVLPPTRPGSLEIHVSADGYFPADPITIPVVDGMKRTVDVVLRNMGDSGQFTILLPEGSPAAGAEIVAISRSPGRNALWRGKTGDDGGIDIPKVLRGSILLIRHPRAASSIQTLGPEPETLRLEPSAPPLAVRVQRNDARPARAYVILWWGSVELSGPDLSFLTWSPFATTTDGVWIARNLPARAVRLAATTKLAAALSAGTVLPVFARPIPYPWPAAATITTAD